MAKTMTPGRAIQLLPPRFRGPIQDGFSAALSNDVQSYIWYKYPWRGSIVELPPFALNWEEPDYGPPVYAVPVDYYSLEEAWLRDSSGTKKGDLVVKPSVQVSQTPGIPTTIAFIEEKRAFRVHPRPIQGGADLYVEGRYKKTPTLITNDNLNSYTLPWDDIYFQVFKAGLKWKVKADILESPDAMQNFLEFRALVDEMAAAEGLHSGVPSVHPMEGLSLG